MNNRNSRFRLRFGDWAIVAGAAEGLGAAYAAALAERGFHLLMVDHQAEELARTASGLQERYGIQAEPMVADLADKAAAGRIWSGIGRRNCRLLVHVAAYSRILPFLELDPSELDRFIDVNCRSQLVLAHGFAARLKSSGSGGGIILMSSLAGLIGMQLAAPYSASKAFAWNLSEALSQELSAHGIEVQACIAGATNTPTFNGSGPIRVAGMPAPADPMEVARRSLDRLGKDVLFIPGFRNRVSYFLLTRLLPRKWAARMANEGMARMYPQQADRR